MKVSDYELFDALGLAHLIKTKQVSPQELLEAAIAQIEIHNPAINAVIYKMYDHAAALIKQNQISSGIFHGVPFLLKDLLAEYAGVPSQFGSRLAAGWISSTDSELVTRVKKAGLIVIGKTNTPEFGLSPVTEPELFGPTRNPFNLAYSPGGSSGGAAAAVAAKMVPMAHGSDGGGSIRIPAAYCGLVGLKPTRGRTPSGPRVMRAWQGMVVDHVLTRTVRDSAAMLDVLAGPELGSPIALPLPQRSFLESLQKPCRSLKIALMEEPFFSTSVHPEYVVALKKAAKLCEDLGHQLEIVSPFKANEEVLQAYLIIIAAEMAAGVKGLAQIMQRKLQDNLLEIPTAILCKIGEYFSAEEFAKSLYVLDKVQQHVASFLTHYDVIMTLTMANPPPLIGALKLDFVEQRILNLLQRISYRPLLQKLTQEMAKKYIEFTPFTPLFNMTGQPAISIPLYKDTQGLPIGIQFAGEWGDEYTLLQLAQQLDLVMPSTFSR